MKRNISLLTLTLVLAALILGVKWHSEHPTPTQNDVSLRQSLSLVTSIKISYFNNPNAFTLHGKEAAEFVKALRVQDETTTREHLSGPSTDFIMHQKDKEALWVTLLPGKTYNDWWLKLDKRDSKFMRVHPITIHYLEQLFRRRSHKLVWS